MLEDIKTQDKTYTMHTYKKFDAAFTKGEGATLTGTDGRTFIDFAAGIGTSSLGYGDKEWVRAVCEQAEKYAHCSNLYYNPVMSQLAEKLCKKTGMSRVFFCNSGAEANEGAIKTARKYAFDKYGKDSDRNIIITIKDSFHGRTVTTLSATGQDVFHDKFFPFTEGFIYCEPDEKNLKKIIDKHVCAVMIECIQGEGGVNILSEEFIRAVRRICDENDILMIVDEVQTGVGRTGKFLCIENFGINPDIITLAKGLGGGLPIGAFLVSDKCKETLLYSDHGSTFGGNPVVCAGANVVVDKVSDKKFLENIVQKGEYLKAKLLQIPEITNIRGLGLMIGADLKTKTAAEVASECVNKGLLILTAKKSLRFLPPLVISKEEIDKGIEILTEVLK